MEVHSRNDSITFALNKKKSKKRRSVRAILLVPNTQKKEMLETPCVLWKGSVIYHASVTFKFRLRFNLKHLFALTD